MKTYELQIDPNDCIEIDFGEPPKTRKKAAQEEYDLNDDMFDKDELFDGACELKPCIENFFVHGGPILDDPKKILKQYQSHIKHINIKKFKARDLLVNEMKMLTNRETLDSAQVSKSEEINSKTTAESQDKSAENDLKTDLPAIKTAKRRQRRTKNPGRNEDSDFNSVERYNTPYANNNCENFAENTADISKVDDFERKSETKSNISTNGIFLTDQNVTREDENDTRLLNSSYSQNISVSLKYKLKDDTKNTKNLVNFFKPHELRLSGNVGSALNAPDSKVTDIIISNVTHQKDSSCEKIASNDISNSSKPSKNVVDSKLNAVSDKSESIAKMPSVDKNENLHNITDKNKQVLRRNSRSKTNISENNEQTNLHNISDHTKKTQYLTPSTSNKSNETMAHGSENSEHISRSSNADYHRQSNYSNTYEIYMKDQENLARGSSSNNNSKVQESLKSNIKSPPDIAIYKKGENTMTNDKSSRILLTDSKDFANGYHECKDAPYMHKNTIKGASLNSDVANSSQRSYTSTRKSNTSGSDLSSKNKNQGMSTKIDRFRAYEDRNANKISSNSTIATEKNCQTSPLVGNELQTTKSVAFHDEKFKKQRKPGFDSNHFSSDANNNHSDKSKYDIRQNFSDATRISNNQTKDKCEPQHRYHDYKTYRDTTADSSSTKNLQNLEKSVQKGDEAQIFNQKNEKPSSAYKNDPHFRSPALSTGQNEKHEKSVDRYTKKPITSNQEQQNHHIKDVLDRNGVSNIADQVSTPFLKQNRPMRVNEDTISVSNDRFRLNSDLNVENTVHGNKAEKRQSFMPSKPLGQNCQSAIKRSSKIVNNTHEIVQNQLSHKHQTNSDAMIQTNSAEKTNGLVQCAVEAPKRQKHSTDNTTKTCKPTDSKHPHDFDSNSSTKPNKQKIFRLSGSSIDDISAQNRQKKLQNASKNIDNHSSSFNKEQISNKADSNIDCPIANKIDPNDNIGAKIQTVKTVSPLRLEYHLKNHIILKDIQKHSIKNTIDYFLNCLILQEIKPAEEIYRTLGSLNVTCLGTEFLTSFLKSLKVDMDVLQIQLEECMVVGLFSGPFCKTLWEYCDCYIKILALEEYLTNKKVITEQMLKKSMKNRIEKVFSNMGAELKGWMQKLTNHKKKNFFKPNSKYLKELTKSNTEYSLSDS